MHIYIDESGIFSNPANKTNVASCVVALVIPSSKKVKLFNEFKKLTSNWMSPGEEVKGKNLNEDQVAQVVSLLQRFDVILEITAVDLGLLTQDEITNFKKRQADKTIEYVKAETNSDIVTQLYQIRDSFNKMSNPLFVQAFIMFMLIPRTLKNAVTYYARRIPKELKSFHWVVDAKGINITEYEQTWSLVLYPIMYTQSLKKPMYFVVGGDYSYFEGRFDNTNNSDMKYYEAEGNFEEGSIRSTKLELILGKSFKFQDSKSNVGLQIADILANATQRALNRKLGKTGWENIGSLMIAQKPNVLHTFKFNAGNEEEYTTVTTPLYGVIKTYESKAKSMWLDEAQEKYLERKNRKKYSDRIRPNNR
jgi:hypothetical protein